jgi:hypothetical protein
MGIFTRPPRVVPDDPCWQPAGSTVALGFADQMGDDDWAAELAYRVTFTLESAPDAAITAWFYAAFAEPIEAEGRREEFFAIRWRSDFTFGGTALTSAPWTRTAYGTGDGELYGTPAEAEDAARQEAEALATSRRDGPSDDDYGFFDWDGQVPG